MSGSDDEDQGIKRDTRFDPLGPFITLPVSMAHTAHVVLPPVYRFLESEYIDDFFRDGTIMLSSASRCARHEDAKRKDNSEGYGFHVAQSSNKTFIAVAGFGPSYYLLSTTTHQNFELFPQYQGCLVIDNPLAFANVVAMRVPYMSGTFIGPISYRNQRTFKRVIPDDVMDEASRVFQDSGFEIGPSPPKLSQNDIEAIFSKMKNLSQNQQHSLMHIFDGIEGLFSKHDSYAEQHEFRFAWRSRLPLSETLIVKVPEAVQFCRRISR